MQHFEIFRAGRHTAASGDTLSFSEADLEAAVAAYDPAVHEAPIVVGHPKDNGPAYGWVKALSYADGVISAEPIQVDAAFAEMVVAGRFKKRSASFYTPDAPNNPKPGAYYLRHVGFLGAQPPAVKGLKDVAFADGEEGVVEFADSNFVASIVARMMRNLREWMIAEKGIEAADKIAPDYLIGDLEAQARAPVDIPAAVPSFSEDDPMKIEELQARVAALETENAALKSTQVPADFAEREAGVAAREQAIAEREAVLARQAVEARIDAAVTAGRLLPAQRKHAVDFAMSLAEADAVIEFGEGEQAKKVTQRDAYLLQIEQSPKVIEYGEKSPAGETSSEDASDTSKVVDKARALVAKAQSEGKSISFTEAVAQATAELSGNA
jgi:hypothetical protein